MPHFERNLASPMACIGGLGTLETTVLSLTDSKREPVVETTFGMTEADYGVYPNLEALLVRVKREVAHRTGQSASKEPPVALWINRLCQRRDHDPETKNLTMPGLPVLERKLALMLPRSLFPSTRPVVDGRPDNSASWLGRATLADPKGLREKISSGIEYIHLPMTSEETKKWQITEVLELARVGNVAIYGAVQPQAQIITPSKYATWIKPS